MSPGLYSRGWWVECFAGAPLYSCWHCCRAHRYRHTGMQEQVKEKGVGKTDRRKAQKNNNPDSRRWTVTHQTWMLCLKSIVQVVHWCGFNQLLVKWEDRVYLLGTVFRCRLIHIWGSCYSISISIYVSRMVCMSLSENKLQCGVYVNKGTCHQFNSISLLCFCVLSVWITMELCGTEMYHRYITL